MADRRSFIRACAVQALAATRLPAFAAVAAACARLPATVPPAPSKLSALAAAAAPPPAPREFRGVWVASVANIDWPSRPGLDPSEQRGEALKLLDGAGALGLNAVLLQVRPAADALYASELEPWSEYLTGTQGQAPDPFYDPLAFWVEEAHRRGIELHAWLNPFRARHVSAKSPLSARHVARTLPDAVRGYGDQLWLDPGSEAAVEHSLAVIVDIARRYDIDGVHIDDYFYPYPVEVPGSASNGAAGRQWLDFPDEAAWGAYLASGGGLGRGDWRRRNVNRFVERMHAAVRAVKPWVKVGISPFGIGRPDRRPAGIEGFSQYDRLYADVELWMEQGWLDYLAPQLYWPIEQGAQAFGVLHEYWLNQNPRRRHVWPGLFTSQVGAAQKPWPADEILAQVAMARRQSPDAGHIHFSMVALAQNRRDIATRLAASAYAGPALVPETPWLDVAAPPSPKLVVHAARKKLDVQFPEGLPVGRIAIWRRHGGDWRFAVQPAAQTAIDLAADAQLGEIAEVAVSLVNRAGLEGPRASLDLSGRSGDRY